MAQSPKAQYIPRKDPEKIQELLVEAEARDDLNDWETGFVDNLIESVEKMDLPELTEPQYQKLREITLKEDDFEVW